MHRQITDRGLASIAGAPSSSTLFAAGDTMAGVGAIIGEFASRIGRSHLEQQHPAPLRCLTNLSLSGCPEVTDTGLLSLKNLTQLRSLDLLGCWMITGAGLASLTTLVQLQSLSVEVKLPSFSASLSTSSDRKSLLFLLSSLL